MYEALSYLPQMRQCGVEGVAVIQERMAHIYRHTLADATHIQGVAVIRVRYRHSRAYGTYISNKSTNTDTFTSTKVQILTPQLLY